MWIDAHGVAHSVALPDPTELMTVAFKQSLDAVASEERAAVLLILEEEEARVFGQDLSGLSDPEKESVFEGLTPPVLILDGHMNAPQDIRTAVESVDWRWRLDVICALDDYIE